jgi:prepilin-type N-terminal cleavage/methylation domain-containing protein
MLCDMRHQGSFKACPKQAGFTIVETLVVLVLAGLLATIAAPGWMAFRDRYTLNAAQDEVYQGMRRAQSQAKKTKNTWQVSVREKSDRVEWATHPSRLDPNAASWQLLDSSIALDSETTLQNSAGVRRVQFNYRGHVNGQLGRVTLTIKGSRKHQRCVFTSTLLGALRKGKEQSRPRDGKYCY